MTQSITTLRTLGPRLAKQWLADGTIQDYDEAKHYTVHPVEVEDLDGLHSVLAGLQRNSRACIIRGQRLQSPDADAEGDAVRRILDNFGDQPSRLFMVDIDKFSPLIADAVTEPEDAIEEFLLTMPQALRDASCVWQLSGSMGHPSKAGQLRAHLWFWLADPLTCEQAEDWTRAWLTDVDPTVHRTVQPNYTATPVMAKGVTDPIPTRLGYRQGTTDVLYIPETMPVPGPGARRIKRAERSDGADPREKQGAIGAFCRAYPPARLCELLPEHFEESRDPDRITWLTGGGAKQGVRICDNDQMLYSSHATAPITRRANMYDFVRAHLFGELDTSVDPEVLQLDPMSAPSYVAMQDWVRTLPAVQAELQRAGAKREAEKVIKQAQAGAKLTNKPSLPAGVTDDMDAEPTFKPGAKVQQTPATDAMVKARADEFVLQIQTATVDELRKTVMPAIAEDGLIDNFDRDSVILPAICARIQQLTGAKPNMRDVRGQIKHVPPTPASVNREMPEWAKDFVWCRAMNAFINISTKEEISVLSFNMTYNRFMTPWAGRNGAPPAAKYAAEVWEVPSVAGVRYVPSAEEFFNMDGQRWLNSYRADLIPPVPDAWTPEMEKAIAGVMAHLKLMFPDDEERAHLLDYMAFCVQNPGVKIRHGVVIKGVEGDGKSTLLKIMGLAMGTQNARALDASLIVDSIFTGWAEAACVIGIEEMKLHGKNRYDVMNKLKPYLTNNMVEIHNKGLKAYQAPNTVNYFVFTNYDDSMPIDENDRRWFFLRTPFNTKHDLIATLGGTVKALEAHFAHLHDVCINPNAGALRKWLLEYPIRPAFRFDMRAPVTAAKSRVVELTMGDEEVALRELLETTSKWVYGPQGIVSATELKRLLRAKLVDEGADRPAVSAQWVSRLLGKVGFVAAGEGDQVRLYDGGVEKKHRIFIKTGEHSYLMNAKPAVVKSVIDRLEAEREGEPELFD